MADDLARQQWAAFKALFGIVTTQQTLIVALWKRAEAHDTILREFAKELNYEVPSAPPPPDPVALEKMAKGLVELERMFFSEGDKTSPVN
jgi:hypothetical protein